mgnify:CR=1 FL=1
MKTICIIGASGYIGSKLSEYYSNRKKYILIGVSRNYPKEKKLFQSFFNKSILGDINEDKILKKIVGCKPDVIIYCVSLNQKNSDDSAYKTMNISIGPLIKLINLISSKKFKTKFLYFSTIQVLGDYSKMKLISENTKKNPLNAYAMSHSICEDFLMRINSNEIDICNIRLANSYGNPVLKTCNCWHLAINDFCKSSIIYNKIRITSNGMPQRDFIHLDDVVIVVSKLINLKKRMPNIMNLTSGITLNLLEIAHKIYQNNKNTKIILKDKVITLKKLENLIQKNITKARFKIINIEMKKLKIKNMTSIEDGINLFFEKNV